MKTTSQPNSITSPLMTVNPELDKYDDVVLFPEKVEKAKQAIARLGLPNLNNNTREK
jgi:hypothetical protein